MAKVGHSNSRYYNYTWRNSNYSATLNGFLEIEISFKIVNGILVLVIQKIRVHTLFSYTPMICDSRS